MAQISSYYFLISFWLRLEFMINSTDSDPLINN